MSDERDEAASSPGAGSGRGTQPGGPPDARAAATEIVRTLVEAGHVAYFAGGCVRDRLMGHPPKDYDIATDARPERVRELYPRAQSVGESFGVLLVRRSGHTIEISTFRTDGVYADGRHPSEVTFTDAEHDASRRDFTINGLFEDPLTGEIIDFVGGRADLEARVIAAIGDPAARLREDRLRMLRAIRFAARFGFAIEAETAETIRRESGELAGVSRERIGQEVRWMLVDANRAVAAWEMQYLGLDRPVLREANRLVAPRRLGRLPEPAAYPTALAAWVLDRCEASGEDPAATPERRSAALMLSTAEERGLRGALEVHRILRGPWRGLGVAGQKRLAASGVFDQGLLLLQAEDQQAFVDVRRHVVRLAESELAPTPLLTGDDLLRERIPPGPVYKRLLDAVYDAQLESAVTTREGALDLARAILASGEMADRPPPEPPQRPDSGSNEGDP